MEEKQALGDLLTAYEKQTVRLQNQMSRHVKTRFAIFAQLQQEQLPDEDMDEDENEDDAERVVRVLHKMESLVASLTADAPAQYAAFGAPLIAYTARLTEINWVLNEIDSSLVQDILDHYKYILPLLRAPQTVEAEQVLGIFEHELRQELYRIDEIFEWHEVLV
nr:hypothetical protein [Bacilli bacterium]